MIATCSNRAQAPDFNISRNALFQYELRRKNPEYQVGFLDKDNVSLLPSGREYVLRSAVEKGASHILFIDDDMKFPRDTLQRLVVHKKQAIGCNCVLKENKFLAYTARDMDDHELSSHDKKGIQEVSKNGLGIFLLDLSVLDNIPAPHFEVLWNDERKSYVGEDVRFAKILREGGVKIYIDHDLSKEIGHIGKCVYTPELYLALGDKAHLLT